MNSRNIDRYISYTMSVILVSSLFIANIHVSIARVAPILYPVSCMYGLTTAIPVYYQTILLPLYRGAQGMRVTCSVEE